MALVTAGAVTGLPPLVRWLHRAETAQPAKCACQPILSLTATGTNSSGKMPVVVAVALLVDWARKLVEQQRLEGGKGKGQVVHPAQHRVDVRGPDERSGKDDVDVDDAVEPEERRASQRIVAVPCADEQRLGAGGRRLQPQRQDEEEGAADARPQSDDGIDDGRRDDGNERQQRKKRQKAGPQPLLRGLSLEASVRGVGNTLGAGSETGPLARCTSTRSRA